jgi:hypothetical protein
MVIRACIRLLALPLAILGADEAAARSADVRGNFYEAPGLVGISLGQTYRNAVDAMTRAAARNIPVPSMSSAFTYRWNASSGAYERSSETFGPALFLERPQTVGRRNWGFNVTGEYLEYDEWDGNKIGEDPDRLVGVADEPVFFSATPHPVYHVGTVQATYGVLDDLDINLALPIANLNFDYNATLRGPAGAELAFASLHSQVNLNVGDLHLRGKYRLPDGDSFAHALGFDVRMPTGFVDGALGTGEGELGPWYAISLVFMERVEPTLNLGFDFNVSDIDRSSGRWAVGMNVQAVKEWLDVAVGFLGRNEVGPSADFDSVSGPHLTAEGVRNEPFLGLDFDRKDYIDSSLTARLKLWRTLVLSGGVIWAANDDGIRSSTPSPVAALEAAF